MIPTDVLTLFFMTALALGAAPGPDNLFVLTQSALHGKVAGLLVTLGLCTGLLVHTIAVALGIAAIFKTSEIAFTLLKFAGAAFLVYLAVQSFRAGRADMVSRRQERLGAFALYRRGIIMNVTNPKVAIFFLALLPQFADPARGSVPLQILMLGGLFILATVIVFGAVALAAGELGEVMKRSPTIQIWLNRIAGMVFLGLAVRLAVIER
ncbi:LysE family translocator [Rhodobacterales bacterium]|nr:LysE family translocator [Rhodobacterales bacterium]